ncbi:hypothetical protein AHMF7605_24680 [Adhaeribacter arboris]|uniref:Bacterial Pleckstrin homology domain-containing protein n=1 Tax=Adhaeribacter arboris TaxID=2072846 RepID=A0A2T2YLS7_9BACT|nr:hypothetical protein [Adhaeribacter arboris]PSR56463.1 hypothetical protein AHMF7605_24680 [Adhaeribacter arboris]
MKTSVLFSETQRFKQWWLWVILLGINGIFLFGVFKQVIGGQPWGNNPMSNTALLISAGFFLLLTILFINFRLDTQIKEDGIYVRFFPFHLSFRYYDWNKIAKSYVREYKPIREFGGWGLRSGSFGKGSALNVSGNQGLQLEFTDGNKLLIGTNRPDELTKLLTQIKQSKS